MSFVIRQYNKSDHDLVLKLHVEGLNQFNARFNDPYLDQDINNIEDHYLKKDGDFIVGLINDRIVGMGAYRKRNNDVAEIKRIRIDKEHQQNGYGQIILNALENSAKDKGYKTLILDTTVQQVPAQKLFQKNEYIETNRKISGELEIIFYKKEIKIK